MPSARARRPNACGSSRRSRPKRPIALRLAAEAEAAARTDVEQALTSATGKQSAQLSAARRKEAELARQEAELVSGAKLPPAVFETRGEVFTLPGSAFAGARVH